MTTRECWGFYSSEILLNVDGVTNMWFSAVLFSPSTECGESECPPCTAYKTCVGPMVQTDQQTLAAGDCILVLKAATMPLRPA